MTPILVNLYGGPGAGKTTTALEVSARLMKMGFQAQYVSEYARDLALEEHLLETAQFDILMEQAKRLLRTVGTGIEVVVTDSPILLQSLYASYPADRERAVVLHTAIQSVLDCRDYVLTSNREGHSMVGRVTDKEASEALDKTVRTVLQDHSLGYAVLRNTEAADIITREVSQELTRRYALLS